MKCFKILALFFFPCLVFAQEVNYNIKLVLNSNLKIRYAYLAMPKNLSSTQDSGKFIKLLIENGQAQFKGKTHLDDEAVKTAYVFVDDRADITMPELISKVREHIWTTKIKNIVVEDIVLKIESKDSVKTASIIKGGKLTQEMMEYYRYLDNEKEIDFFREHPDSPISLFQLQMIVKMYNLPIRSRLKSQGRDPKVYYPLLSKQSQTSIMGLEVKKKIDML